MREKLISDHGRVSSYEGQQRAANGQDSWGFFMDVHAFGGPDTDSHAYGADAFKQGTGGFGK